VKCSIENLTFLTKMYIGSSPKHNETTTTKLFKDHLNGTHHKNIWVMADGVIYQIFLNNDIQDIIVS